MSTDYNKPTPRTILKLANQLNPRNRLKVISELIATLGEEQLEELRLEVEQALTLQTFLGETQCSGESQQKQRKTEIKYINGKAYAYLRWRDRSGPDQYLGSLPLLPNKTYRLTHKINGTVKVLTVIALELDELDQVSLVVQFLEPYPLTKRYLYPDCIKQVFSKKEWDIQQLSPPLAATSEVHRTEHPTQSLPATTPTSIPNIAQKKAHPKPGIKPKSQAHLSIPSLRGSGIKPQARSVLNVENRRVALVLKSLELWATLSQILTWTPQWQLIRYPHKTVLLDKQGETVVEYNRRTQTLETAQSVHCLFNWLQEILVAVTQSPLAGQQQQSLARRLFARLQQAPQHDSGTLLAYLFNLSMPQQPS